jgi:hypothetical protein
MLNLFFGLVTGSFLEQVASTVRDVRRREGRDQLDEQLRRERGSA